MLEMKRISVKHQRFFYSFSFDIDDFVGDGIYWLQIYNDEHNLIYDRPFAWNLRMYKLDERATNREIRDIIKHKFFRTSGVEP